MASNAAERMNTSSRDKRVLASLVRKSLVILRLGGLLWYEESWPAED